MRLDTPKQTMFVRPWEYSAKRMPFPIATTCRWFGDRGRSCGKRSRSDTARPVVDFLQRVTPLAIDFHRACAREVPDDADDEDATFA